MSKVPEGYTIGISSGIWGVKKEQGLLGIPKKIEHVATTAGTTFTEVALDSMTEFAEPDLKKKVEKAVDLSKEKYCGVSASYQKAMELTYEIKIKRSI